MDMLFADVTGKNVKIGDKVFVYDNAEILSKIVKTSPYEILTNFSNARTKSKIITNN